MADRFPLIVNATSKKIEELVSGDNLDLTGNGIIANGTIGVSGQYLKSTGSGLIWDNPGDVYLTATQTLSNKTLTSCTISGSANIFSNIPNSALVNSGIIVNGTSIPLGSSVVTPDNNTTYSISAIDGGSVTEKIIRLTSGGNAGAGVDDDITLVAGSNVSLSRVGDAITINSSFTDTNTVTRLQSGTGGTLVSGDITIAASGSSTVSQSGNIITISSTFTDTITRLRAGTGQTLASGDFTLLQAGATTITQAGGDITISSQDTITRIKGGGAGSFTSGDVTFSGAGATTVSQAGSTVTITSIDNDTITRLRGTTGGIYTSGDITLTASGATTVSQVGSTINISSVDTNTTYSADSNGGIVLAGTAFSLKNSANFTASRVLKWDDSNKQFTNSIISDNGSSVTINGDFTVTGTTTTLNTTTLIVSDNEIELRRGNNLVGSDGGIRLNRTTNSSGVAQTYTSLQWFESGGFWRIYDGSISSRLVTETESQTLTNKTLTSPILTSPSLGIATATTINGLTITTVSSGTFTLASGKTLTVNNTATLNATDGSTINFGNGGGAGATVAYNTNTLSTFASTTSTQLRGVITDSVGTGFLVFNTNPSIVDSLTTSSSTFALLNTTVTTVNAFGNATAITIGSNTSGTTTIRTNLTANKSVTLGSVVGDTLTINGTVNFVNADIAIRGSTANPIRIGRGGNAIASNTRVGFNALQVNSSGSQNTAFGFEASAALTSGAASTSVGYRALRNANTGTANTAFGRDALLNLLNGNNNTAIGVSSLNENQSGSSNVCIGHFAGYNCLGSGNVLIGPADDENSTNATYQPPSVSGDRQLIIGSGTGTWLRGDNNFDVTAPQNFNVGGSLVVSGNLTINGTTTTINSSTISVDDKTIEIGAVVNTTFIANVTNNSANITGITPTAGLIPGMVVTITTAGLSVPAGTTIVSITNNTAVLSNNVSGASGTATFNAFGPSDTSADGGGVVLRGTTDKSITWSDTTDAWTSTENFDLATGKQYRLGNVLIASSSQIGPSTGTFALGGGVTASSLTSVGTLTSLTVTGAITANGGINLGDGDKAFFGDGNDLEIFHDGGNSVIKDVGTGNLVIAGDNAVDIYNSAITEVRARFLNNAQVELYYDNAKKFETTSTGATVTGALTVTDSLTLGVANTASAHINSFELMTFNIDTDNDDTNRYFAWFKDASSGAGTELLRLDENGELTTTGTTNLKQITETVVNAFNTTLAPSSGTLTVDTSTGTVILGDLNASVTTWAFTNVPSAFGKATTVTVIIDGDTAQTYGDACNVNGSAVSGGVKWSGGSAPTATNNFDIITFTIVRDSAGTINVFGSGNTDFS